MGAWGEKAFENDAALDWLAVLEAEGVTALRTLLARVADAGEDDPLDVDDGAAALAAAEIVAAALGRGRDRVSAHVIPWLEANAGEIGADDLASASRAVKRVLGEGSELRALWEESGQDTAWHANVRGLVERLGGDTAPRPIRAARKRGTAEGRGDAGPARGQIEDALVTFLFARGLRPTEPQMQRIRASSDPAELERWLARAISAASVEDVLDGDA